ncbi:uncharacterized protein LOC121517106 isoform X2 [Xyrichtys novacula]|uniref:Uncharacterized protein LOC121517106 isoform X2 n=1 Tax=Xyrichtys novacula TaxID=13765 RepID=A0AAV1HJF2_XYRNO|nr:uncharacterized protein LOC121517106 isoform X2 [Xyrichtys novacula]
MDALVGPMQTLFKDLKANSNLIIFSVLVFVYQAVEREFPCSCQPQALFCLAYMLMPAGLLFIMMLATDAQFQRALKFSCWNCSGSFCWVLTRCSLKALCVGLLWVAAVLLDAEFYVCCWNENSRAVARQQCERKMDVMTGGEEVVTINEMVMNSRLYGMSLLLLMAAGFLFLMSGRSLLDTKYNDSCCFKRNGDLHEIILEVGEEVVSAAQKKKREDLLKETVKKDLEKKEWVNYLEVVEQAIKSVDKGHQQPAETPDL